MDKPEKIYFPTFDPNFLDDHAKRIVNDPKIALVEIVANAWDAGADTVRLTWPKDSVPEVLSIEDNGIGMTRDQFLHRWLELNYNRLKAQGDDVIFPSDNKESHRRAFGRNGKGRHSMFCFSDDYFVETWRDGYSYTFQVSRPSTISKTPFEVNLIDEVKKEGHGTKIWATLGRNYLPILEGRDLIGSKFIADPSFSILINSEQIELASLKHLLNIEEIKIEDIGSMKISLVDTTQTSRTSNPHGIAWWVNKRLVGEVSWKNFKDTYNLDRRTIEAKRYTFIVEADPLLDTVLEDWSGFIDNEKFQKVRSVVEANIKARILSFLKDIHKTRKVSVIKKNINSLSKLNINSRYSIGKAIDQIQSKVPTIQEKILEATVEVLVNLEESRTGYFLIEQLSDLDPDELDQLSEILDRWTIQEARIVLGELENRLKIIEKLEQLVEDPSADELHEIQPLFEIGLWIFGPEYESIHFTSNRTLLTVFRDLFEEEAPENLAKRKRPDFVIRSDSTIGVYASNSFDHRSEVSGFEKVLIVELKRGGYKVSLDERRQGEDYARELRKSGKVQKSTNITVFVLGSQVSPDLEELEEGETIVYARPYASILQQAHARTFFLLEKIKELKREELFDPEIEETIKTEAQVKLF